VIDTISLAWSLRITCILCGVANLISALLIRNRNTAIKPPQHGLDTKLIRRYEVLLQLARGFTSMLGYMIIFSSLSDFAISIGLSASQTLAITALLKLCTATKRRMVNKPPHCHLRQRQSKRLDRSLQLLDSLVHGRFVIPIAVRSSHLVTRFEARALGVTRCCLTGQEAAGERTEGRVWVSDAHFVRVLGVLPICVKDHTIFAQYWHKACFWSAAEEVVLSLID